jgi:hypothetical protein
MVDIHNFDTSFSHVIASIVTAIYHPSKNKNLSGLGHHSSQDMELWFLLKR